MVEEKNRKRRIVNIKKPLLVNLSKLLDGYQITDYDDDIYDGIEIIDDCPEREIDNFVFLSTYKIKNKLILKDLSFGHHKKIMEAWPKENEKLFVSFRDNNITEIFAEYDPEKEIINPQITLENITRINPANRYKITNIYNNRVLSIPHYREYLMPAETFLGLIDILALQISKMASNDVDKIVLVNKFIKDNIIYDRECYAYTHSHNNNARYYIHPGHFVQSVFKGKAVCSAIAPFATILLNHPLLNVKTETISEERVIEDHAWNNVLIDGKWYTCDFTWTIYFNPTDSLEYILIKTRTTSEGGENSQTDYNRNILQSTLEKYQNYTIGIPRMYQENNTTNKMSTSQRRPMINIDSNDDNKTPSLRRKPISIAKIITDDNETPHLRRKPIAIRNIKDDETPKSLRRKPIITVIENRY